MHRQHAREDPVVEAGNRNHDGDPVEPGEIPAQDQHALERDGDDARGIPDRSKRHQVAERRHQLGEVIEEHARFVDPRGQPVEVPAERIRDRLALVVVDEASEVAPARIAAQLDEPRAEHQPEEDPSEHPDHDHRRRHVAGAEEDREKTGLEQQRLPAETVPRLPHVHEREIEEPHHEPDCHAHRCAKAFRDSGDGQRGADDTDPRECHGEAIGVVQVEERRRSPEGDALQEERHRGEAVCPEQRPELVDRHEKAHQVDHRERSLQQPAREPVVGPVAHQRRDRAHRSALSAACAALKPAMPCTPPPGGVDAEQRYQPFTGTV